MYCKKYIRKGNKAIKQYSNIAKTTIRFNFFYVWRLSFLSFFIAGYSCASVAEMLF